MKIPIKYLFPILMAAIGIFFAVMLFFGTEHGIYTDIGNGLTGMAGNTTVSRVNRDISGNIEIPSTKYVGGVRHTGDVVSVQELFQFIYKDGTVVFGTDGSRVTIYLKDIKDDSGKSMCSRMKTNEIEAEEEISAAFTFDTEQDILYIHKSGIYQMLVKVYFDAHTSILYEFSIPVEVG